MSPLCPECQRHPATFIKGISLCAAHVEQLTQLARTRSGKTVGTTTQSILEAIDSRDARTAA